MLESIKGLRDWAKIRACIVSFKKTELLEQLDAIEREVEERYIELPKDADGEYIRIGDKLVYKYLEGNSIVECTRLTFADDWIVGHGRGAGTPNLFVHHKPSTVEDVLLDACRAYHSLMVESMSDVAHDMPAPSEIIAEYAAKLRLANDGEAE